MPTTYTHQRFGSDCLAALPGPWREAVERRRGLYDTGVHGPDIFFYYHPVCPNRVTAYGSALHRRSAREFFTRARLPWMTYHDRDVMLSYLLGFLTHFALDSACHGYVNSAGPELGVSHNRLEAVYDAYLMRRDGLTPTRVMRGAALEPTEANAVVVARFFDVPEKKVLSAMRGQETVMRLLYSPDGRRKRALRGVLRTLHIPGHLDDIFIDDEIPPNLGGAMDELDRLYAGALAEYPDMARSLVDFLDGRGELSARFDRDFE